MHKNLLNQNNVHLIHSRNNLDPQEKSSFHETLLIVYAVRPTDDTAKSGNISHRHDTFVSILRMYMKA